MRSAVLSVLGVGDDVVVGGAGGLAVGGVRGAGGWVAADPGVGAVAALAVAEGATLLAGGAEGIAWSDRWSGDRGRTWRRAEWQGVLSPVTAIVTSGREALAATIGAGVLRSADAGRHWVPAGFGLASHEVWALAWGSGATVFAATEAGVHVSPNAGRAWRRVSATAEVRVAALAVDRSAPDEVVWAVGEAGEVLRSADGGGTWASRASLPSGVLPSAITVEAATVLVAGSTGLLRSDDDGATWERVHDEPGFALVRGPRGFFAGTSAAVIESADGRNWTPLGDPPPVHDVARLVVVGDEVLGYGTMTGVVRWGCDGVPAGLDAPRPVSVLAAGADGVLVTSGPEGLARSVDTGASWQSVVPGEAGFVHVLAASDDGTWWAASGDGARLLRSGDEARTWAAQPAPWGLAGVLALDARGGSVLAATYDAGSAAVDLWRLRSGQGWDHSGRLPVARPTVALSMSPPVAVFDGRWMFGRPDGRGWQPGAGPPGAFRRLAGRGDRVVVLTDEVLAETHDGGRTWTPIADAEPARVRDIALTSTAVVALLHTGELWTSG